MDTYTAKGVGGDGGGGGWRGGVGGGVRVRLSRGGM